MLKLRRAGDTVEIPLVTYTADGDGKQVKRPLGVTLEVRTPTKTQGDEIVEAIVKCSEAGNDLPLQKVTWKLLRMLGVELRGELDFDGQSEIRFDPKMSLDDPVFDALLPIRSELALAIASLVRMDETDLGN